MARSRRKNKKTTHAQCFEHLEMRVLFAVHNDSFDVTQLTQLRSDSNFSTITGKGVSIAVLDTGVDAKNPDLSTKVQAYYNAVENAIPASISSSSVANASDSDGHGTHTSGTAASANPNIGVAYGAGLVDVKVIADSGETQLSGDPLLRGLEFVQQYSSQFNIKVVSMSLGESDSSGGINLNSVPAADDISREIQTLEALGITVVSAAGNSYANNPTPGESYPAVVSTIGVASTWSDKGSGYNFNTYAYGTSNDNWAATESSATADQFSATSQRSTLSNQVVAPGVNIYSDWNGSSTDNSGADLLHNTLSGTSMATPFVAGLVALMQQAAVTYGGQYITDPEQVLSIIRATSDVIQDPTIAGDTRVPISNGQLSGGSAQQLPGTGASYDRVNVYKAIQAVKALFSGTIGTSDTNNTTATATSVPILNGTANYTETGVIGTDGLNKVGANDVDLYKITLDETGSLTATMSDTNGGTAFIASIRLFDSAGNQIKVVSGTSAAGYPTLATPTGTPLSAGTYFVGVSSAGNVVYSAAAGSAASGGSTTGDYNLTLSLSNPDPNGVPQGAVAVDLTNPNDVLSNNTVANKYNGTLGSDPAPLGSTLRVNVDNGDVDMFKIVAPDTGTLTATADTSPYGFNGADTYTEVLDSNLNVIASNGQASNFPSSSQIQFHVTIGQTYYVAVTVYANHAFNPTDPYTRATNSTATESSYDLYLAFDNGNTNGTALLATSTAVGHSVTGKIGSTNANLGANGGFKYVNWYTYTASAAGLLDLTATATSSGFSPNIQLWTLSSDNSSITEVGGLTGSGQSLIDQVAAGQTVYVSVTGAGNSKFNWYSLGSGNGGLTGTYSLSSSMLTSTQAITLNDSSIDYGTPGVLTTGKSFTGNIGMDNGLIVGSSDVDLNTFTPTTTGAYDIQTDTSQEGSADTYLRLFDSGGALIASDDNASTATTASFIRANLVAGQTYYIGVSGTGNESYSPVSGSGGTAGASGTYVLTVVPAVNPAIAISNPPAVSPGTTGASITFTVSLDFASTNPVTVDYSTVNGTAIAGVDFTPVSGTLTFGPGQTSLNVSVPILLDSTAIDTTTFTLDLSSPSNNAVINGGQGTGTITNPPVVNTTFGGKKHATYTDSNGRRVQLALSGPGSATLSVIGSNAGAVLITLNGTTNRSHLSIISNSRAMTDISSVVVNGSLSSFSAPHAQLVGDFTVSGTLGSLVLGGARGDHTLSIAGTAATGVFSLGSVTDLNVVSAEPLRSVASTTWTNLSSSNTISAPTIGLIRSNGDFGASVSVAGELNLARIGGAITGGNWNISGSTGSILAGSIARSWAANFAGAVKALVVNGDASGAITAASIRSLRIRNDFSTATLNLTAVGTHALPDLSVLWVGGTFSTSTLRSGGDIGSIHVGAIIDSSIFAGVSSSVTALPTIAADFVVPAQIVSFVATGVRGSTFAVSNSAIAASQLGKVVVAKVNTTNGGVPFGFSTQSLASLIDMQPHTAAIRLTHKSGAGTLTVAGDFTVNLV